MVSLAAIRRFRRKMNSGVARAPGTNSALVAFINPGSGAVGTVFTASLSGDRGYPSGSLTYQWKRDGSNISGATSATYTAVEGDADTDLTVTITCTNASGSSNDTSDAVAIPALPVSTTYYVATTGNDSNPGTAGSPRLTIAAGLALLAPGDTLIVGDGTYNEAVAVTSGGSPGAYKTIRAANLRQAILAGGGWGFDVQANYVAIDGLKFSKAGGGGGVQCGWERHHISVLNCEMEGGSDHGIAGLGGEFYRFEGNYVHGGRYGDFWSGISIYQGRNTSGDTTTTGFRNVIRNNIVDDCYQIGGFHTDGNGIIVDDFHHSQAGTFNFDAWDGVNYPYETLVENNLCTRCGGKGIQVFVSDHVTVRGNTAALNNRDRDNDGTWRGEISCQSADDCTFVNNIGVTDSSGAGGVNTGTISRLYANAGIGWYSSSGGMTGTVFRNNLGWDIGGSSTTHLENNAHALNSGNGHVFADPEMVDVEAGDYRLLPTSPALNAGTATYGLPSDDLTGATRVQGGTVDIGCYEGSVSAQAPAAFGDDMWELFNAFTGGELTVDITALPSNRGSAITALQYRVDGGSAASFTGTGTGERTIASLTDDVEVDIEIRAVNAVGNGDWSPVKSATPTSTVEYGDITHVASSSAIYGSRTNTTVTAPSGIADDDALVGMVLTASNGTPPTPSLPAGFDEVAALDIGGLGDFNMLVRVGLKRAASESGDYTFTHASTSAQAMVVALRGVDWNNGPFAGAPSEAQGSGTTRTWDAVTLEAQKAVLLALGVDWADTTNDLTAPSGMTEVHERSPLVYAATETVEAPGSTGTRSHSCNSGNSPANPWGAIMLPFLPMIAEEAPPAFTIEALNAFYFRDTTAAQTVSLGDDVAGRTIWAICAVQGAFPTGVTLDGNAMDLVYQSAALGTGSNRHWGVWKAAPTGTSANLDVTTASTSDCPFGLFRTTGLVEPDTLVYDYELQDTNSSTGADTVVEIPAGGGAILHLARRYTGLSGTGVTQDANATTSAALSWVMGHSASEEAASVTAAFSRGDIVTAKIACSFLLVPTP